MATEVTMPRLGLTMVEAKIIEWSKREGEVVEKGEVLFVIETEKVTFEVEAPTSGILGKILVPAGETKPIGEVLAYILEAGEELAISLQPKKREETGRTLEDATVGSESMAAQHEGRETITKVNRETFKVSPVARNLAKQYGVDIAEVIGTGPEGRIIKKDILKAVDRAKSEKVETRVETRGEELLIKGKLLPLSGMRRTIARRMSESFQVPHFWTVQQADATKLKDAREDLMASVEAKTGEKLSYTDLIIKIVSRALEDYPIVNSKLTDKGIEVFEDINVGLAMNVEGGLIVPVIRQTNKKSLPEITKIRVDIVKRGRDGKLGIDEMTGSTITVTNRGMTDFEFDIPLLNPPETAILSIGAIRERPFVVKGQVVALFSLYLTLGIDHRVLDGSLGAQFLNRVKELIERPLRLF